MKREISPLRKNKLENRHKGYHRHFRNRFGLLRSGVLTKAEFILWDYCYSDLADWDIKHQSYENFDFTNAEIGWSLGWDETTVSKVMASLIIKGFIMKVDRGVKKVTNWRHINHLLYEKKVGYIPLISLYKEIVHSEQDVLPPQDEIDIDIDEIIHDLNAQEYKDFLLTDKKKPPLQPP